MTLEEKAKEYALKALESEIDKVQKAYIEGYNAAKAEYNHEPIIDENGIKWHDMELPSGNLWSEPLTDKQNNLLEFTYNEAKEYDLPTPEDLAELKANTKNGKKYDHYSYLSINGNRLMYYCGSIYWCKKEPIKNYGYVICNGNEIGEGFIGERHYVILVKRKQQ